MKSVKKNNLTSPIIYLIGGGEFSDSRDEKVETSIIAVHQCRHLLIIPWTTTNKKKLKEYRQVMINFFRSYNFKSVNFLERTDLGAVIRNKFTLADLVYLPGGDPVILANFLKEKKLKKYIMRFHGTIIGISAGAYVLSRSYLKMRNTGVRSFRLLGIADIFMKAHYEPMMDEQLRQLSMKRDIFAIADNSAVAVKDTSVKTFMGQVFVFKKGKKIQKKQPINDDDCANPFFL